MTKHLNWIIPLIVLIVAFGPQTVQNILHNIGTSVERATDPDAVDIEDLAEACLERDPVVYDRFSADRQVVNIPCQSANFTKNSDQCVAVSPPGGVKIVSAPYWVTITPTEPVTVPKKIWYVQRGQRIDNFVCRDPA